MHDLLTSDFDQYQSIIKWQYGENVTNSNFTLRNTGTDAAAILKSDIGTDGLTHDVGYQVAKVGFAGADFFTGTVKIGICFSDDYVHHIFEAGIIGINDRLNTGNWRCVGIHRQQQIVGGDHLSVSYCQIQTTEVFAMLACLDIERFADFLSFVDLCMTMTANNDVNFRNFRCQLTIKLCADMSQSQNQIRFLDFLNFDQFLSRSNWIREGHPGNILRVRHNRGFLCGKAQNGYLEFINFFNDVGLYIRLSFRVGNIGAQEWE